MVLILLTFWSLNSVDLIDQPFQRALNLVELAVNKIWYLLSLRS